MPKIDTVSINPHALAEQLRSQQLKQWWVARQIGVTPLTVNRWLTGKVRRISPENLKRLSGLLGCEPGALSLHDESEARATQVEQSRASRLLVSNESQDMFLQAGHLETYERLIKAVMHPNLSLSDLLEIYTLLTMVAGLRGDFERSLSYARLKLDYALRCGDAEKELEARINLATAQGALGNLIASHRGLLELFSAAESQGAQRSMVVALINLTATFHLLGDVGASLRSAIRGLELLQTVSSEQGSEPDEHWRIQASSYIYFAATSVALESGEFDLVRLLIQAQARASEMMLTPIERETLEQADMLCTSLQGGEVDPAALDRQVSSTREFDQFAIGGSIYPAVLLRRSGRAPEAQAFLDSIQDKPCCQRYESAYIAEERARINAAGGKAETALDLREQANQILQSLGMLRRIQPDPALEFGSQFRMPARLRTQLQTLARAEIERQG